MASHAWILWMFRRRQERAVAESDLDRIRRYQRVLAALGASKTECDKLWPQPRLRVIKKGTDRRW